MFWDECAKLQDKSDAKRVHIVTGYSEEGFEELKELTGEDEEEIAMKTQKAATLK